MTAFLPPNLLALFAARDPIPYVTPADKLGHEKKRLSYGGVAQYLKDFEDPKDTPPPTRVETKDERKERKRKERAEQIAYKLEQDLALWDPHSQVTTDPYKSLFVARVNYDTSESKLRREFEVFGPVRKIKVIHDKVNGKPRGYAFIEYEHERDMHSAYKHADGKKIDGRRVLVDVERGRTVKGWRPRRLGGGLGGTRKGGPDENTRFSGRDDYSGRNRDRDRDREDFQGGERGGQRGGDRGGDRGDRGGDRGDRPERPERPERPDRGDRGDREVAPREERRERRRSRSRERRRRSRSRDKKREGEGEERKRSRRSRSRDKKRSRSRDRERKRRRSRSRERKVKEEPTEAEEGEMGGEDRGEEGAVEGGDGVKMENGNEEGYEGEQQEDGENGANDDGVPMEG